MMTVVVVAEPSHLTWLLVWYGLLDTTVVVVASVDSHSHRRTYINPDAQFHVHQYHALCLQLLQLQLPQRPLCAAMMTEQRRGVGATATQCFQVLLLALCHYYEDG